MNKIVLRIILVLALLAFQSSLAQNIQWQPGNWAFACDFTGGDLKNVQISGDLCGGRCATTNGCTHFTWTTYLGGTCWMKSGNANISNAFYTGNNTMACGVVQS